jgi:hypothetical protein
MSVFLRFIDINNPIVDFDAQGFESYKRGMRGSRGSRASLPKLDVRSRENCQKGWTWHSIGYLQFQHPLDCLLID